VNFLAMQHSDVARVRAFVKKLAYASCGMVSVCLHPFVRLRNWFGSQSRVRVLAYHRVCDVRCGFWREDIDIAQSLFAAQMKLLAEEGYTVLRAGEVVQRLRDGQGFPSKAVCITFDDGYRNNFTHAFPELRRHGLTASFFVVTDYIDSGRRFGWMRKCETNGEIPSEDPRVWEPLRWPDIMEMSAAGMEIGSHSSSHADFGGLQAAEMLREVADSKRALQAHLGNSISPVFVCPFGAREQTAVRLIETLRESAYLGAFTGRTGAVTRRSNPFDLPRLTVYAGDSLATFRRKVTGAYDWLVWFQPIWVWLTRGRQA
jgi:peptidoglycan/xylan/chitin deacetylase (PgdA/CDA1 family)